MVVLYLFHDYTALQLMVYIGPINISSNIYPTVFMVTFKNLVAIIKKSTIIAFTFGVPLKICYYRLGLSKKNPLLNVELTLKTIRIKILVAFKNHDYRKSTFKQIWKGSLKIQDYTSDSSSKNSKTIILIVDH